MCIYGILFENGKWYVGRTNDFNRRKSEHLSDYRNPSVSDYESEKYRAMRKYEFEFVILEEVKEENLLSEREKYWIKHKDSLENGYNMSEGGESYNLKGEYHSQAKLTKLEVEEIRDLLRNTKIPYEEIANKYNVSKATISNINTGSRWNDESITYPLRVADFANRGEKNHNAKFTDQEVVEIRKLYKDYSITQLSEMFKHKASASAIKHICDGSSYKHLPIYSKTNKKWINLK